LKNKKLLFVLLSSILTGLSQQSYGMGFLVWFSLVPFIFVINKLSSFKDAFKFSFIWGFIYHLMTIYWLAQNIGTVPVIAFFSMLLGVFYLSFNTVLIILIWYYLKKYYQKYNLFLIPIIWVSIEYIKSYGLLAFPWISLANTQLDYLYLIQIAEITGIYGVSFWIISLNVILYSLLINKSIKKIYLLVVTFLAPWIFGYFVYNGINQNKLDDLNISLIQPNIKLSDSRDYSKGNELLNKLIDKTKSAIDSTTDLVIWPEAALPFHNIKDGKTFNYIKEKLLMDNDISILSGDITLNNHKVYNSVILFDKNGVKSIYNKQRPVPLAEQVPLSETFPMLENINLGVANYSSGKKDVLFDLGKYKFSSLICYESTFPEINRRHVNKGADFITFLVNDAWYTHGLEPEQHARQSIFRAIENRRTVLRCANTGISMIIDPTGNIIKKTKLNTEAVILGNIKGTDYKTFYTKFGNVFAQLLFIIMGVLILKTLFRYEKNI
tara:strand:+ start:16866 stop:18350 length:1485 start_codon:yes stop_codon:yes gene_type:complete